MRPAEKFSDYEQEDDDHHLVLPRINAATHANWFFISPKLCIPPILYMVAVLVSVLRSDLCRGFDDI